LDAVPLQTLIWRPRLMHLIENIKIGLDSFNSLICVFRALLSLEMTQAGVVEFANSIVVCERTP
jgi:hypothetical protein